MHVNYYLKIFFCLFVFFRATPTAYGGSQARGLIGAVATGLHTPEPQQRRIQAESATYTTAHGNARSLTLGFEARDRTRNLMVTSRSRFCCTTTGTPFFTYFH